MFNWKILGIEAKNEVIHLVKYFVSVTDGINTVEAEGYHSYLEGSVNKPFAEIKEEDLIRWLVQDTTKNEVNIIKLNLEKQLESLKSSDKADFPWLANTFTIE
jgi:hypothetical protein